MYEYGSRAGFWRIHNEIQRRKLPMTIFGVAMALVRNPYIVEAIKQADYDVVSHGYRWLHYQETDLEVEKQHMEQALSVLENLFGNKT
ncbi:polysaccharide deacetylase family protein, partial [Acinetobacter baumannii]|uniref:polysaccharide deacetylase family protein n=1 Tax=Acinetobacter baumannii TaxID=470 RepID=UPI003AF6949D